MQRSDFILRKFLFALATLVVVIVFNFFLFRILPGDPIKGLVHTPRMTREAQENIKAAFGLDKPVWLDISKLQEGDIKGAFDTQFTAYVRNLFQGNFGISFVSRQDVGELISKRVGRSVVLLALGEVVAVVLGIVLGIIGSWRRGSMMDTLILLWGLFTWSMPTFFFGIILVILARGHLPTGMMVTAGLRPEDGWVYWSDVGRHVILPTVTMGIGYISMYLMVMRSSVTEVLSEDYILTAKAKGLSTFQIFRSHAIKNAMLPMITIIALTIGYTVGGAIQVETVFSWPGIGRLIYDSVGKQDYPVLQGAFLLIAVSVILTNFLADLLYTVLDPRVKVEN
ncbi:MAG: ABC transporter permease [Promethearchaeota archaeon]|jgi:peptide/nickel transport system permease protein